MTIEELRPPHSASKRYDIVIEGLKPNANIIDVATRCRVRPAEIHRWSKKFFDTSHQHPALQAAEDKKWTTADAWWEYEAKARLDNDGVMKEIEEFYAATESGGKEQRVSFGKLLAMKIDDVSFDLEDMDTNVAVSTAEIAKLNSEIVRLSYRC